MQTGWGFILEATNLVPEVYLVASMVVFIVSATMFIRGNRLPLPKDMARPTDFIGLIGGVLISGLLLFSWIAELKLLPFMA